MSYINLNIKTCYSLSLNTTFLDSIIKIDDLISYLKNNNIDTIGVVDRNNLYAAPILTAKCKENNIRLILGIEVDSNYNALIKSPIIIYFKNLLGYQSYLTLAKDYDFKTEYDLVSLLKTINNAVIALKSDLYLRITEQEFSDLLKLVDSSNTLIGYSDYDEIEESLVKSSVLNLRYAPLFPVRYFEEKQFSTYETLKFIANNNTRYIVNNKKEFMKESDYFDNDLTHIDTSIQEGILNECNFDFSLIKSSGIISKKENEIEYLKELANAGLRKRLNYKVGSSYQKRLDYELEVISKLGYVSYFIIVQNYVAYAKRCGMIVGAGRGSAASSLVSYAIGITDINPLKYGLLFERFLNIERAKMPDIDIDFEAGRRDEIFKYLSMEYPNGFSHILTISTIKFKSALRDIASINKVDEMTLLRVNKEIAKYYDVDLNNPILKNFFDNYPSIKRAISTIINLPRQLSTHASGVIISIDDLSKTIPTYRFSNYSSLLFEVAYLEKIRLLKMDILGLTNLSFIANLIDNINKTLNQTVNYYAIPLDDKKAIRLLQDGFLLGLFQIDGSSGMKRVVREMKPNNLNEISDIIALYRPGPMDSIPLYFNNRKKDIIELIHPDLDKIIIETHGVIIYQEQIMLIASNFAGMSLKEADIFLNAMRKKDENLMLSTKISFYNSAKAKGIDEETVSKVYSLVHKFASYGFNKAHSISYATIIMQEAYLKAHYPLNFYKALFDLGYNDKYKSEVLSRGINLYPPLINSAEATFVVKDNYIIFSLKEVKGISSTLVETIVSERKERKFDSIFDFMVRISKYNITEASLKALIATHAFLEFKIPRAFYFRYLKELIYFGKLGMIDNEFELLEKSLDTDLIKREEMDALSFNYEFEYILLNRTSNHLNTYQLRYTLVNTVSLVVEVRLEKYTYYGYDEFGRITLEVPESLIIEENRVYEILGVINRSNNINKVIVNKLLPLN